ncbi:hypothetical protein ANCCAN_02262 [Ancylostoma caninum]|uniref:Uncharacterized protein n=1 Tax=Ancylostoma caninum TaxID=29170 RepID=A0A368H8I4_ANCCA|nr:hypothetical protein ANCCAN_02262 [Ancylostoma caninum]
MKSVLSNHAFIRRRIFPSIVVEDADKRFDNYNEAFARRVMFPISAAAYSSDPFECLNETLGLEKDIRRLFSYEWRSGQCSGYVAQLRPYSAIALGFRGMEARDQLVQRAIDTLKTPWVCLPYFVQYSDHFHSLSVRNQLSGFAIPQR